jgi:hypothetical protein
VRRLAAPWFEQSAALSCVLQRFRCGSSRCHRPALPDQQYTTHYNAHDIPPAPGDGAAVQQLFMRWHSVCIEHNQIVGVSLEPGPTPLGCNGEKLICKQNSTKTNDLLHFNSTYVSAASATKCTYRTADSIVQCESGSAAQASKLALGSR